MNGREVLAAAAEEVVGDGLGGGHGVEWPPGLAVALGRPRRRAGRGSESLQFARLEQRVAARNRWR